MKNKITDPDDNVFNTALEINKNPVLDNREIEFEGLLNPYFCP